MAKLPDPLSRRHLLEQDLAPAKALAVADGYLAQGRVQESLAFLAKAGARDRLEEIWIEAVREGDAFLVREVAALLGRDVEGHTWSALADAAEARGKTVYAELARRNAAALEG